MKTHNEIQGSESWLALRRDYFTASEAAAMMGVSPYMTRSDLLKMKATGIAPEVDGHTQARFDDGHATEAAFRPVVEQLIGEDLYPVTGSIEIDGLQLLASFDGLNMSCTVGYEHKRINAELRKLMATDDWMVPDQYVWQLEQQLLVSGASGIWFCASDGTEDDHLKVYYESTPELRVQLIAAWQQFKQDLDAYVPQEYVPAAVGRAITALPAVSVQVSGVISIIDNFEVFKDRLVDFIDNQLIREPETDQDFADLELQIKALKGAEEALNAAEANMLSQVEAVDTAKRMKDMLHKLTRDNRLMAEKLLEVKKLSVKADIVRKARDEYDAHIRTLNERIGKPFLSTALGTVPNVDFAAAIKGKRTIDSLREAASVALANGKIASSAIADKVEINLKSLRELAKDHAFLFADTQQLVTTKANDDLVLLINSRIATHKAAEEKRLADERERIRLEEVAKLEKEKADEAERETIRKDVAAAMEKRAAEAAAAAAQPKPEVAPEVVPQAAPVVADALPESKPFIRGGPSPVLEKFEPNPAFVKQPQLSDLAAEYLTSREWPTQTSRNAARAVLLEFEEFCSLRGKVVA